MAFKDIGYDVTVVERLPSDNCGDRSSRHRAARGERAHLMSRDRHECDLLAFL